MNGTPSQRIWRQPANRGRSLSGQFPEPASRTAGPESGDSDQSVWGDRRHKRVLLTDLFSEPPDDLFCCLDLGEGCFTIIELIRNPVDRIRISGNRVVGIQIRQMALTQRAQSKGAQAPLCDDGWTPLCHPSEQRNLARGPHSTLSLSYPKRRDATGKNLS